MEKIVVRKKTGFQCLCSRLVILDNKGREFYTFTPQSGKVLFNLPKGLYWTKNDVKRLAKPVTYKLPKLRKRTTHENLPEKFNIIVGNNPNKVSVFLTGGDTIDILVDKKLTGLPKYKLVYFLFHELGHFFYRGQGNQSEIDCDTFAQRQMLIRGYNPSQTWSACHHTLNSYHVERRDNILNNLGY